MSLSVIDRAETSDGEPHITMAQEIAIKHAFVMAGVEFTLEGPRMREVEPRDPEP